MPDPVKPPGCSAVILAGGLNSRMGGRNKAFLKVGGREILDRTLDTLGPLFEDILLVTREPGPYRGRPVRVVTDVYDVRSSLTGIHAGLVHAAAEFVFMVACDAPFLQPALVRLLLGEIEPSADVIVPVRDGHYEPLCAIYSKRCIPFIEHQLDRQNFRIFNFFDDIQLKVVADERLRQVDAGMRSFFNVNTPHALQASQVLADGADVGDTASRGEK